MRTINNKKCFPFMDKCCSFLINSQRRYCNPTKAVILGIETSCDDTGCAIVDTEGNILGEALYSQHLVHLK